MQFKDYYQLLEIERDASQDEVKRAYRKLARKYHPDVSKEPDAEERFKEVNEAYEVLKDPEKRAAYDQLGSNWQQGQDFRPPPDWDQGFEFHGGTYDGADAGAFSDFFESLFGRGGFAGGFDRPHRSTFHAHGNDTHAKVFIDLADAYTGAKRQITLKHTELDANGRPQVKNRTLNVTIPKGVAEGQLIRLAGQGEPGVGQGKAGDLYLEIHFQPGERYTVEGKTVYMNLPVAPWEAALGATVRVPTPAGAVDLRVPPNCAHNTRLRLKGRGIPAREPGDLFVVVQIVQPPVKTEAEKAAYQQLSETFNFNPRKGMGG